MGLIGGLSFNDAVQTYTMLTVGDGLVTQIPSLLTSICAGIIVTRVSGGDSSSLGMDLHAQLFAQPVVLVVTAVILGVFALVPGVPAAPFAFVALLSFGAAILVGRTRRRGPVGSLGNEEASSIVGMVSGRYAVSKLSGELAAVHRSLEVVQRVFLPRCRDSAPRTACGS